MAGFLIFQGAKGMPTRKEPFDIYIGRAGRGQSGYFGNPFSIGAGVTREHAIEVFPLGPVAWAELLGKLLVALLFQELDCGIAGLLCAYHISTHVSPADIHDFVMIPVRDITEGNHFTVGIDKLDPFAHQHP